jgi:hypothetical protein
VTQEEWQKFIKKAADAGIILEITRVPESKVEIRRVGAKSSVLVDYTSLMK